MSLHSFEQALSEVAPHTQEISLHLMGEPLAHPEFARVLDLCDQHSVELVLTSNGLLLSRHLDVLLGSKGLKQINISIQSYLDNYPQRPFGEYLDKISHFIDQVVERRPSLYINLRLWNLPVEQRVANSSEHRDIEKVLTYLEQRYSLQINRKVDVGHIKSKKLFERVYLHFDSRFQWPRLELPENGKQGRCHGLINQIGIHADGTVVPCCLDDQKILKLGNIFEQSFEQILASPRAQSIRQGFECGQLKEELCQRCDYIKRFKK